MAFPFGLCNTQPYCNGRNHSLKEKQAIYQAMVGTGLMGTFTKFSLRPCVVKSVGVWTPLKKIIIIIQVFVSLNQPHYFALDPSMQRRVLISKSYNLGQLLTRREGLYK